MTTSATHDVLERLLQRFLREELPNLSPNDRAAVEAQFEERYRDLIEKSTNGGGYSFPNLIGFGPDGVKPFDDLPYPRLKADFDESVTPSQVHASAELYFIYQHIFGIVKLQNDGTLADALAIIGQDQGQGIAPGMKQPG